MRQGSKPGKIGAVVSGLGSEIVRGTFLPGQALPPEHELEARFGASRGVVREAIKILAAKGLISVRPRFGTHVKPRHDWSLLDQELLGWLAGDEGLDRALFLAFEETRAIIEPAAAALAAQRAEPDDVARIMGALEAMEGGQTDPNAAIAADKDFHLSILEATHNPVLRSFRGAIEAILSAVFDVAVEAFSGNLENHAAVAHAIAHGNAGEAQKAMERVLGYTFHHLSIESSETPKSKKASPESKSPKKPREKRHEAKESTHPRSAGRRGKPARSSGVA
jgi:GntR family transcriptional regulator, galactonate operon transcriptional repressor